MSRGLGHASHMAERIAVITGGSRGIGLAAAHELGRLGFRLVIVGQHGDRVAHAVEQLAAHGCDAVPVVVDVSDGVAVHRELGEHPLAQGAEVLITSAGVMSEKMAKTLRTSATEWDRVMGVNLNGTFHVVSAIAPAMAQRRLGRIITVSACLGRFSGPGLAGGLAPYRISKAGVNALTKNLAAELGMGTRGVLVDAMCPNHTRTDMGGPDAPRSPQEAADTIVWLATREHNADTVTGVLWEDRQIVPW